MSVLRNVLIRTFSLLGSSAPKKKMRYFPNKYELTNVSSWIDDDSVKVNIKLYLQNIKSNFKPITKHVDGGIYVGCSGVAYMYYYISKKLYNHQYHLKASDYITPGLKFPDKDKTSFLLGDAGTQALAAVIFNQLGDAEGSSLHQKNYQSLFSYYLDPQFLSCGGDELFVGRAGYIAGALWLNRELGKQVVAREDLHQICDVMVNSGKEYSRRHHSPCPLMYSYYRTEYLGAAHGICFILQMLITVPGYLQSNPSAAADIKKSIDFLLTLQLDDGNWPCTMEEVGAAEHKLVHWCHGAPGIIYLMARAYIVYGDKKYLDSCIKAADVVWNKGLLRKGPGLCHGVAGNGYVFLLLYRLTKDDKYLKMAYSFADFMQSSDFQAARVPDSPYSLYEGTAGTVCFLADLLDPNSAEFPFQDVFTMYENIK